MPGPSAAATPGAGRRLWQIAPLFLCCCGALWPGSRKRAWPVPAGPSPRAGPSRPRLHRTDAGPAPSVGKNQAKAGKCSRLTIRTPSSVSFVADPPGPDTFERASPNLALASLPTTLTRRQVSAACLGPGCRQGRSHGNPAAPMWSASIVIGPATVAAAEVPVNDLLVFAAVLRAPRRTSPRRVALRLTWEIGRRTEVEPSITIGVSTCLPGEGGPVTSSP
jgi:hypothetical protein